MRALDFQAGVVGLGSVSTLGEGADRPALGAAGPGAPAGRARSAARSGRDEGDDGVCALGISGWNSARGLVSIPWRSGPPNPGAAPRALRRSRRVASAIAARSGRDEATTACASLDFQAGILA